MGHCTDWSGTVVDENGVVMVRAGRKSERWQIVCSYKKINREKSVLRRKTVIQEKLISGRTTKTGDWSSHWGRGSTEKAHNLSHIWKWNDCRVIFHPKSNKNLFRGDASALAPPENAIAEILAQVQLRLLHRLHHGCTPIFDEAPSQIPTGSALGTQQFLLLLQLRTFFNFTNYICLTRT